MVEIIFESLLSLDTIRVICSNDCSLMVNFFFEFIPVGCTEGTVLHEQASDHRWPRRKQ